MSVPVSELAREAPARIGGEIGMASFEADAEFTPFVGIVAAADDRFGQGFGEFGVFREEEDVFIPAGILIWPEEPRYEQVFEGEELRGQDSVRFSILMESPRRWIVEYEDERAILDFDFDVGYVELRCVSGSGWVRFDMDGDLIS